MKSRILTPEIRGSNIFFRNFDSRYNKTAEGKQGLLTRHVAQMCKSPRMNDKDDVKQGLLKCHVPKRLDRLSIISFIMLKRVIITYF